MIYAIALEAYDKGGVDKIDKSTVQTILRDGPTDYPKEIFETYKRLILSQK